ncbi:MAG: secreted deoxyriboendonuclease [Patescibacteria group bacterium]|nr:secreted deoxyriboendonuclease [Patescibacteria group bacterium]
MKHKTLYSIIILVIAIAAIIAIVFLAKKPVQAPSGDQNANQQPNSQDAAVNLITVAPTSIAVDHDSYLSSVTGSLPQFPQASDSFNKKISDGIMADVAKFNADASADYDAKLKTGGDEFQKEFADSKNGYYSFSVGSNIVQSNENYISVAVREEGFTGGAHGFHNVFTYNYDVKNKKEIAITDLTTLDNAASRSRAILSKKLAEAANVPKLDQDSATMMEDGTDPTVLENFQQFTFTQASITFYFGEYQVAPYVFGEQDVTIPRK